MHTATKVRSCGECEHHETSLTVCSDGDQSFPGLEFWCRQARSSRRDTVVRGPEAASCAYYVEGARGCDAPL
jgi:hypothetical protein